MPNQSMPKNCCIVGGGMLGLTLAHKLLQRGCAVTLYEASSVLGGLASTWQLGDIEWDRHYHVILASDSYLRGLLRELDLEREIAWVSTQTGFFTEGRLVPFTGVGDFLRFPALGWLDKARLLSTIAINSRLKEARSLEQVSVSDYLIKSSGRRVFEQFWLPLLRSKLGENYTHASASFIWATIYRLTAARRAGIQERFGYVRGGGYRTIVGALARALQERGAEIHVSSPVQGVRSCGSGVAVTSESQGTRCFEEVYVTTPGPVALQQCSQLSEAEKKSWSGIRYQGIICASLLLNKPLSPYYLTNISDARVIFTGVVEMSAIVPVEEFGNRSLVYLPKYLDPADALFEKPDDAIRAEFLSSLKVMYPDLSEQDIEAFRISRVRHVFPVPTLGYSSNLPPLRTSIPGVFIVNSAHVVNDTLNVNGIVRLAEQAMTQAAA